MSLAVASRTVVLSAVLFLLILSAVDSAFAAPAITLTPTCGGPGTIVSVTGTGFNQATTCFITSSPPGLISGGTSSCTILQGGSMVGSFTVADQVASGIYVVTVTTNTAETATVVFNTVCPASQAVAVGGFVEPVNKLIVFAPFLALLGIVAAAAIVITAPWKREC